MPSATVNGATLVYQWDGDETKPVLVLSNSLTTDMRMWEPLIPAFTEHFRVLRYNNRGHGGSSSPAGEYTMDDIAGDALARVPLALAPDRLLAISMHLAELVGAVVAEVPRLA